MFTNMFANLLFINNIEDPCMMSLPIFLNMYDNEALGCYECIIVALASIAASCLGMPKSVVQMHATALALMTDFTKMKYAIFIRGAEKAVAIKIIWITNVSSGPRINSDKIHTASCTYMLCPYVISTLYQLLEEYK
jgi:hypothetical protein